MMNAPRHLSVLLALLLTAGAAAARTPDSEWISYRDAYRAMVVFDKYGGPKNLLQSQFQLVPAQKGALPPGMQLSLQRKSGSQSLALDATGRAVLPLVKAAYDENAALVLTGGPGVAGFRERVTIAPRTDGLYDSAELRAACGQALDFLRYTDATARARACVGVRFVYPHEAAGPLVRLRSGTAESVLAASEGGAFADDGGAGFRVVNYRFGEGGERRELLTSSAPLLIAPLID